MNWWFSNVSGNVCQHKCVERPVRPVFPDYLSVSCDYDLINYWLICTVYLGWTSVSSCPVFREKSTSFSCAIIIALRFSQVQTVVVQSSAMKPFFEFFVWCWLNVTHFVAEIIFPSRKIHESATVLFRDWLECLESFGKFDSSSFNKCWILSEMLKFSNLKFRNISSLISNVVSSYQNLIKELKNLFLVTLVQVKSFI